MEPKLTRFVGNFTGVEFIKNQLLKFPLHWSLSFHRR